MILSIKRLSKDSREALDKTLVNLREKEDNYNSIVIAIQKLVKQKEEIQKDSVGLENEVKAKEEILQKMVKNIEFSQKEDMKVNDNIIFLTEKEKNWFLFPYKVINFI